MTTAFIRKMRLRVIWKTLASDKVRMKFPIDAIVRAEALPRVLMLAIAIAVFAILFLPLGK